MTRGRSKWAWWLVALGVSTIRLNAQTLPATGSIFGTVLDARFNEISDFQSPRIFQVAIQVSF